MLLRSVLPYRDEHLARLQSLKKQGTLVTLGPTEGSTHVFGIFEADSIDVVRRLEMNLKSNLVANRFV